MDVLVVESPAKAKTIGKYLGPGYTVLASYGHVRDLPPKDGSVRPDEDFAMDWEVDTASQKRVDAIAKAVTKGGKLYLATDPDREGEAISWHVLDILSRKKALQGVDVKRVTFNSITKQSVLDAVAHPRDLDQPLIDAYLARRALDYLVGFNLSPVLWRKLPGSRSAGRVQSVALRLICERESEIEVFKSREYWTVDAVFGTAKKATLKARLTHLDGRKLDKFDLDTAERAERARKEIERRAFSVASIDRRQVRRNPPPPFITSTLQQEASRKLGLGAATAMRIAQKLYEGVDIGGETVGLITYMRTDGVQLAPEAIGQTRRLIETRYGQNYVPEKPRVYTSKAKNAQEAHEAVRPTDLFRLPQDVAPYLDKDQLGLYELIWKRTVASQMESAVLDQVTVDIASGDKTVQLRTTGSVVKFPGFLTLYDESQDDKAEDGDENATILPDVQEAEALDRREILPEQHFTEPPPRYSEASLVKKMEELGIGRPSTYASIIEVLQRRNYVKLDRKRFIPEDRGRIVTSFLQTYFPRYVEYGFTAHLEEELDDISSGKAEWHQVLREFWKAFSAAVGETKELRVREVLDKLDEELGPHFFPANDNGGKSPRTCPSCADGRLGLKLGRFGAFIGCSNYPTCKFTRKLGIVDPEKDALSGANLNEPKLLGTDEATGKAVTLRNGPYGLYIQLGVPEEGSKDKPKRASLLKGMTPEDLTFEKAQAILALPRELGPHPEDKEPVLAGVGRFGPYVRHGSKYKSIPADESVLEIGMNRAVALLAEAKASGRGRAAKPLRIVGNHPADNAAIELYEGRYGMYVKHDGVNATVPTDLKPEELTVDQAVALLAERAAKGGGKKPKKAARAKKAAPAAANDTGGSTGNKPKTAKKKAAPKKKAAKAKAKPESETPPRTGTDG
ncbi:MAG: type I DNA topoisomerase [Proteobacteria bacterium]|nr:type I DNA topoisomerase [Pseudomonadota bacterium]